MDHAPRADKAAAARRFAIWVEYLPSPISVWKQWALRCSVDGSESMPSAGTKGSERVVIQSRGNKLTQFGADSILA